MGLGCCVCVRVCVRDMGGCYGVRREDLFVCMYVWIKWERIFTFNDNDNDNKYETRGLKN